MTKVDVLVIGGGPAGINAARRSMQCGAATALVESAALGGMCVNASCIPSAILAETVGTFARSQELAYAGLWDPIENVSFLNGAKRRRQMVRALSNAAATGLASAGIKVLQGRGRVLDPHTVSVTSAEGAPLEVRTAALVIATGSRWVLPSLPGLPAEALLTPDAFQDLVAAPKAMAVSCEGSTGGLFGVELATLAAGLGVETCVVAPGTQPLPAFDTELTQMLIAAMEGLGCSVYTQSTLASWEAGVVTLDARGGPTTAKAETVLCADVRQPELTGLGASALGLAEESAIQVDAETLQLRDDIWAAGDVTGQGMLASAALEAGTVAGENAAGGDRKLRLRHVPYVGHGIIEFGWVGLSETEARRTHKVRVGAIELAGSARAATVGPCEGAVKVVSGSNGEILGVHALGPGAGEIVNVAALMMQTEVLVDDLARSTPWHPSWSEVLIEAARAVA